MARSKPTDDFDVVTGPAAPARPIPPVASLPPAQAPAEPASAPPARAKAERKQG